jgi:hypothetical protein
MSNIQFSLKYDLPGYESGAINMYDAGEALVGASRAFAISMHYFVNGKVIKQAPSLKGADVKLLVPKNGSFIFDIDIAFATSFILTSAASGVIGNACYEYLKHIFSKTVGQDYGPSNSLAKQVIATDEGAIDAMVDTIEGDFSAIHRPIIKNGGNVFIIGGKGNVVNLDSNTYDYVSQKVVEDKERLYRGRISSYNANSGRGRIFIRKLNRVVPFEPPQFGFSQDETELVAWSLNEYVNNRPGDVVLEARAVRTQSGLLKSLKASSVKAQIE